MKLKSLFRKYPFIFIGLGFLIFVTIILVIAALNVHHTSDLEILIAPTSATVTIDGKKYENGTFYLDAGEHTIHIKKEGFVSQDITFDTATTSKIYTYLKQTDGGYSWYLDHPEDALILTQIGDYLSDEEAKTFSSKHQIMNNLPIVYADYDKDYNYTEYRIDGGSFIGCESNFCLKITDTTGGNLESAKQQIRSAGFNPDDYQILYEYIPIQKL